MEARYFKVNSMVKDKSAGKTIYLIPSELPKVLANAEGIRAFDALIFYSIGSESRLKLENNVKKIFKNVKILETEDSQQKVLVRAYKIGATNPVSASLSKVLEISASDIRVDKLLWLSKPLADSEVENLKATWCEPAIEEIYASTVGDWSHFHREKPKLTPRRDDSWDFGEPEQFGIEFELAEKKALKSFSEKNCRPWNKAELELFAQTWSEHCKHKIFAAKISGPDIPQDQINSLFKTYIRKPTLDMMQGSHKDLCLSVFHDNAGVLRLIDENGQPTEWAYCLKMETHNSPSAIAPYGGASTGIVGVHRDILGTGQGAMPISNWDVLCFESPEHFLPRPPKALPADIVRLGVIKGIEDGGNQSGIPTVQGSVNFHPGYAIKPLVYAGSVGLLPVERVNKKPRAGLKLYCVGGAVGADGLHGAVMSSRDIRGSDFSGSMVQVANAFVQRRVTDFLLEARDKDLIDVVTDNGAGGLASSCGEMASLSGGATIELSKLRTKYEGLLAWEYLLSESQERMTVATHDPVGFEALANEWNVEWDFLGELTNSGHFQVTFQSKKLVDIPLSQLHEGCPQLELSTDWKADKEAVFLRKIRESLSLASPQLNDYKKMLCSFHLCSREAVVRRFDHEVQGRTLRKPFGGLSQHSAQDGSLIEVYEAKSASNIVLSHGLAPWKENIIENTWWAFDEALRSAVISGVRLETMGALDNFCWPDPIKNDRHLWRLVKCCETLEKLCRYFSIPLISGKDSMKNNSKDFEVPATLVVSMGGSAHSKVHVPAGFFSRSNEILYYWPALKGTLKESAWERVLNCKLSGSDEAESVGLMNLPSESDLETLKNRYSELSSMISKGKIRSAKDVSEGGLLHAVFEMCLGRNLGVLFEDAKWEPSELLQEGLGGIVLGVDPHMSSEVESALSGIKRLGVTTKHYSLYWNKDKFLELSDLEEAYFKLGREGFWS